MTIDEAIAKHTQKADRYKDTVPDCDVALKHRQLAEWLKELKELRILVAGDNTLSIQKLEMILAMLRAQNSDNDIALCELCEKAVKLQDREAELKEAKRLLKLAVDDMMEEADCGICLHDNDGECPIATSVCDFKWRYADEAEKLLKGD